MKGVPTIPIRIQTYLVEKLAARRSVPAMLFPTEFPIIDVAHQSAEVGFGEESFITILRRGISAKLEFAGSRAEITYAGENTGHSSEQTGVETNRITQNEILTSFIPNLQSS